MNIDHYNTQTDQGIAERKYLIDNESGWLLTQINTKPHYLLCSTAKAEYLDVQGARDSGYYAIRSLHTPGAPYSIIAMSQDSGYVSFKAPQSQMPEEPGNRLLDAIRDAARDLGLDARRDYNSSKGNDLLIDGKKWCGYSDEIVGNDYLFGVFITFDVDREMLKRIDIPSDAFDGKQYDTADDRITALKEVKPGLSKEDVISAIRTNIASQVGVDSYSPAKINDKQGVDKVFDRLTSDEEVFRK